MMDGDELKKKAKKMEDIIEKFYKERGLKKIMLVDDKNKLVELEFE